jgi:MOSC domain-containing protein YiiM
MSSGRVEGIFIGPENTVPAPVESARAVAGRGLEGNRHFYDEAPPGRALTLIQAEALAGMLEDTGIQISAAESRRNVLTSGIDLNALVGKRFRVGGVECVGVELCHPCSSLEKMTQKGVIKGLVNRGGLNADILTDGVVRVGDRVEELAADSA